MIKYINPAGYKNIHIGILPPPHGGISTYLYRLSKLDNGIKILNKNDFGNSTLRIFFKILILGISSKTNFIVHASSVKYFVFLYFANKILRNRHSVVIHGQSLEIIYNSSSKFLKFFLRKFLDNSLYIQVVGEHLLPFIKNITGREIGEYLFIQNAFLPPPIEEKTEILNSYPPGLLSFISTKRPLLVANAYSITFYQGTDLYGLDMCIEVTKLLKKVYADIGFIFAIANLKSDNKYFLKSIQNIEQFGLSKNFLLLNIKDPIWPIFTKADIMIRPTNTDGDAVSIRESLFLNCPVIASDVTHRPPGTVLFQNRNCNDMLKTIKELLNERDNLSER